MPAGDIATTKQFVNGQLGVNGVDLNQIIGQASIQPAFYSAQSASSAPASGDQLVLLTNAGTSFYRLLYQNLFSSPYVRQGAGVAHNVATINGDMTVWQNGTSFTSLGGSNSGVLADMYKAYGTLVSGRCTVSQQDLAGSLVGGTNNYRPRWGLRVTVTTSQASLTAGEYFGIMHRVERSQARKLFDVVSSQQIWVRSSVAGTFSFGLRNANGTESFKQDFSVGTPNSWQQLLLPNITVMPDGTGNWGTAETDFSYEIDLTLACGSTFQSSTMSSWIGGNFLGSSAQTNLFATNGATFDMVLLQHEDGALCSPFLPDSSLAVTLAKCRRYFRKSYDLLTSPGTATQTAQVAVITLNPANAVTACSVCYDVPMRTSGVRTYYSPITGTANVIRDLGSASDLGFSSDNASTTNISQVTAASPFSAANFATFHYTTDASL